MTSTHSSLAPYSTRTNKYSIGNSTNGYYFWVFSQKKIHYIKSLEDGMDKIAELSSGLRVPMNSYGVKDNYFCYRSSAPILRDNLKIKIIFE